MPKGVTSFVARMTSAIGGHGSQFLSSACSLSTAQIMASTHLLLSPALTASVERRCKYLISHFPITLKTNNSITVVVRFNRCPPRECHGAFKCKGDFVDSFAIATLEGCIEKCGETEDCAWFTLEKSNDHCILYEECNDQFDCETCATGEKKCANGFKGNELDTF